MSSRSRRHQSYRSQEFNFLLQCVVEPFREETARGIAQQSRASLLNRRIDEGQIIFDDLYRRRVELITPLPEHVLQLLDLGSKRGLGRAG